MTTAEAVEMSVTTINSLSQDFTNLDDQPSQTLTDTPGFKPFTLYTKQQFQIKVGNEIIMHFLLSFISSLN